MLEIVEILRPAEQGRNTAFLCRGEDGLLYFVKGKSAGKRRLCCEWVIGNLAKKFGLPVPDFNLVLIPEVLLEEGGGMSQKLGSGIAFASEAQNHAQWMEPGFIDEVPQQIRLDVLVFDWWVRNDDRIQDNPNLLWNAKSRVLHVIDHDAAFSPDFFPTLFRQYHIFHRDFELVLGDIVCRDEYVSRMLDALLIWEDVCNKAPLDWIDATGLDGSLFNPVEALMVLKRCSTHEIWRMG